ncbi:MAG: undecaprenyl-phosphate glucose phosphotransferase [Gammaproteobacteria bacterium]|nr:undecaprenyl-phosphate glucose phosphotransferase [Gammaproteobacteria bacterium]
MNFAVMTLDALSAVIAGLLAWFLVLPANANATEYSLLVVLAVIAGVVIFSMSGLYRSFRAQAFASWFSSLSFSWFVLSSLLLFALWALKVSEEFSRLWLGSWFLFGWLSAVVWRLLAYALLSRLRSMGYNRKHIVIVGAGRLGQALAEKIQKSPWTGYQTVAFFDDNRDKQQQQLAGISVFSANNLQVWVQTHDVDEVWFALPLRAEERLHELLHDLRHSMVNIRYVPNLNSLRLLNHAPREVLGFSMLDLSMSPMSEPLNRALKLVEDKLLSLLIILLISPLMLLLAVGVKLSSPGPVFYRQQRHGWNGEAFEVLKFRSMVMHTEQVGQVTQAKQGDARITPFGAFLRRTSLDELPQFFNVIKGDMSIVGPRPHALAHNDYYSEQIDGYMLRHKMKPGITGWAQVNGWRGETDTLDKMQKRVEYDLWYIEHWSLWLDLKIIIMTLFKGFVHKNAR